MVHMQNESHNVPASIVERLFRSFTDLESAIRGARETLKHKEDVPSHVFERLDSYDQIIARQRGLARDLEDHIAGGDMMEISRHVMIINSLSGMIIDDAKQILSSLSSLEANVYADEGRDDSHAEFMKKIC